MKAVENVIAEIQSELIGLDALNQSEIDQVMGCLYNLTKEDAEWFESHRAECKNVSLDVFELSLYTLDELANSLVFLFNQAL